MSGLCPLVAVAKPCSVLMRRHGSIELQVIAVREVFDKIDLDGSDRINRPELRDYMMKAERAAPDIKLFDEAESIFSTLDRDRSGEVTFHELLKLWYPYLTTEECKDLAKLAPTGHEKVAEEIGTDRTWQQSDIDNMRKQFMAMDISGDGEIDRYEFEKAMVDIMARDASKKAKKSCIKMINAWFDEIDVDQSGNISFEEFVSWYRKSVSEYKATC